MQFQTAFLSLQYFYSVTGLQQLHNMDNSSSKKQRVNNGRWTHAEHRKFMDALDKYGKDWVKIQKKLKTRTALQIRSHAQKVFLKMSKQDIDAFIGSDEQSSTKPKKTQGKSLSHPSPNQSTLIPNDQNHVQKGLKRQKEQKKIQDTLNQRLSVEKQNNNEEIEKKELKVAVVKEISHETENTVKVETPNYEALLIEALREQERLLIQSLNMKRMLQSLNMYWNPFLFPYNKNM